MKHQALLDRLKERLEPPPKDEIEKLSRAAVEALMRLVEAGGEIVPYDRLSHCRGRWANRGQASAIVTELRFVFGPKAVATTFNKGYSLGEVPDWLSAGGRRRA